VEDLGKAMRVNAELHLSNEDSVVEYLQYREFMDLIKRQVA
jgi:hypothetical protein